MSAFVLNRQYELQLPNNYVDVDREEMEYLDGGVSVSVKWYGVNISFTERETQTIVKALSVSAGAAAVISVLATMGVVTAIGSAAAALVSAALWTLGGYIDFVDYCGGNKGVSLKILWIGTPIIWPN